ncbi:MAG: DegT/DnrJ/EryC1/StrS family aminotransferase [Candidatus Hydrogenedentes bacterium]|nr:DegT/DnrJ/EryC1/StrS family aminotransferase [Candidatus Hydrogenedentota bacterium]
MSLTYTDWPSFSEEEIEAVGGVLRSGKVNYWTGTETREFEKEFAAFAGSKHAVALANGTLALELALRVLGVKAGDEVVVTPRTFIASASAAVIQGMIPVFADVDRDSGNITAESIAQVLTPRTKAIVLVHIAGWPCDMDPILALACERGIKVIEDCAQCHGAMYKGRPCGSLGDIAAWSFCQDKIMTTGGEGGMITLNDDAMWEEAWTYKDHGKSYDAIYRRPAPEGYRWLHEDFGTNWRLTEMQSVLGRIQLKRMPEWKALRARNAGILAQRFGANPFLRVPLPGADFDHAYYKFHVFIRPEQLKSGWTRDRILSECDARGIPCRNGVCGEIYMEKAFEKAGLRPKERLPVARELGETSLMFMVHPTLSEAHMHDMADRMSAVFAEATAGV